MGHQRQRAADAEARSASAAHEVSAANIARRDAEAERDDAAEKLNLAMIELHARAERIEYAHAQLAAARTEVRMAPAHARSRTAARDTWHT